MPSLFPRLQDWMFTEALPFWSTQGIDRKNGGYVEHFSLDGQPYIETKRVFVVCRQIYVFAHASVLGFADGAELALHGHRFLEKAWLPDQGGFARRVDASGRPVDETPDLYVLAFALFALAWLFRLTDDPAILQRAHQTLDFIEKRMAHESGLGYLHEVPATGPRQQNPHMHLTEGLLALAVFSGESRFADAAGRVAELFVTRFFNARSETLAEFFAEDFSALGTQQGRMTEPGHQFEWAWILHQYQRLTGQDMSAVILGLHRTAEQAGVDPATHATYNIVRDDGVVLNAGSRIWPNTERMKAAVALFEMTGRPPLADIEQSGTLLLDAYLKPAARGCWIDHLDGEGRPCADKVPASSFYHLFLAFAETLRIAAALGIAKPSI